MDDLISRQVAIDAFRDTVELMPECYARDIIADLPSAQPKIQLSTEDATFDTTFDCISRQAAIDALAEQIALCDKALNSFGISMKDEYAVKVEKASLVAYRERLEALPAANVVPVVHGKWIPQDHNKRIGCATTAVFYYPKCSACGHNGNYDMYYCPNCGAKMDCDRRE